MVALRDCFPNNLRRILRELPKSLDETYDRILKDINNANQKQAHLLLQCLVVAIRPLRVEELAEVLALDFIAGGIPKFNPNWRWENHEEAVLSACSSLVSVIIDNGSRVVQFSHFSVKEFLTSTRLTSMEEVSRFHIAIEPSHVILAQACLGVFLCLDDCTDKDTAENMLLYEYARDRWLEHVRVGNVESQIKNALDYFFETDNPHLAALIRIEAENAEWLYMPSPDEESTGALRPEAPLFIAAEWGISGLTERLIIKQPQAIHFCSTYGTPLHHSVLVGHIEVARLLLAHGADINSRSADNSNPLHIALQEGHLEIGKWLLNHGADVTCQDESGSTPLHLAASQGLHEICQILLERNADVHVHDNERNTPLHFAASEGHLAVARILVEHNPEVNFQNDGGSTPFLRALQTGNPDIAQLLLDHGADVYVHDNSGNTPLHFAASGGHVEVARIILERNAEVNFRNEEGSTPLLYASTYGHPDLVRLLLDHNADVHVCDNARNRTPLHHAAIHGHLEVSRMLLERNADVNSRADHGSTPLLLASEHGTPDVVQLLLDHNADVNVHDGDGDSPLHCAALRGQLEIARILLGLNVEINSRNEKGSTPLHLASAGNEEDEEGHPEVVRLLLDHGADAQAHNHSGETASEVARGPKQQEIVHLLSQHAAE